MSIPVRETDSYESAPPLRTQRLQKSTEAGNETRTEKIEGSVPEKEDTVKISREARARTKEFEKTEERKPSETKDQTEDQKKLNRNSSEKDLFERTSDGKRAEQKQQNRENENRTETAQRELRRIDREDWDRIEDERIDDRKIKEEQALDKISTKAEALKIAQGIISKAS